MLSNPATLFLVKRMKKQPILHFIIKAKVSASAPLALTDRYCTRWRPEEAEIKLSNVCKVQEPFPGVNKVTS